MATRSDIPSLTQGDPKTLKAALEAAEATKATAQPLPLPQTNEELLAEVRRLREDLEQASQDRAAALQFVSSRPRWLRKTVEEDVVSGQDRIRDTDLWEYRIDLPPSGGTDVSINGVKFFHGQTYQFTTGTLRSVMDAVHRCWAHEASINNNNETAYRKMNDRSITNGRRVNM